MTYDKSTIREQADRHRDARGLSSDQRRYIAATLYSWWRNRAPTGPGASFGRTARLVKANRLIDEGSAKYPALIREVVEGVRARIDRFAARRATPDLVLTCNGPKFIICEYDNWGYYKGKKELFGATDRPFSHGVSFDWIGHLSGKVTWDSADIGTARNHVALADRGGKKVPDWFREAVRDWDRIARRKTLVPTAYERQRYRRAAKRESPKKRKAVR